MIVDCDSCVMREIACSDCFVTALLDLPPARPVDLDDETAGALEVLADAALVPPLRLVTADGAAGASRASAGGRSQSVGDRQDCQGRRDRRIV